MSAASLIGIWAVAGAMLAWCELPHRFRVALALAASGAGLVFLVLASGTEGFRETQSTSAFLLGPPQVTALASASASLPYYVLTAACLLFGALGVIVSDARAQWLAQRRVAWAAALGVFVALMRFGLEKAAAPASWTSLFGIVWLGPVVGAWFYLERGQGGLGRLCARLLLYALIVRGTVAVLYAVATRWRLGSHYDVSSITRVTTPWGRVYTFVSGSFEQLSSLALLPQLVVWPVFTLFSGLCGAAAAAAVLAVSRRMPR